MQKNVFNNYNFKIKMIRDYTPQYKNLEKNIKKDTSNNNYGLVLPKKIKNNEFVIGLIDEKNNSIISFVWFGVYSTQNKNEIHSLISSTKYTQINFSYTFEAYRNNGLNNKLRKWIENFCFRNKIKFIISVPLHESNSISILNKLKYKKNNEYFIKKIF